MGLKLFLEDYLGHRLDIVTPDAYAARKTREKYAEARV
jgi:hypothetical protein